jgi:hypothetical protein
MPGVGNTADTLENMLTIWELIRFYREGSRVNGEPLSDGLLRIVSHNQH